MAFVGNVSPASLSYNLLPTRRSAINSVNSTATYYHGHERRIQDLWSSWRINYFRSLLSNCGGDITSDNVMDLIYIITPTLIRCLLVSRNTVPNLTDPNLQVNVVAQMRDQLYCFAANRADCRTFTASEYRLYENSLKSVLNNLSVHLN